MLIPRKSPLGTHFFDRTTGINMLIDEVIPPSEEWSPAPRTLSVALTDDCDSSCSFCYVPKRGNRLLVQDVLKWATELSDNGGQCIGFGGGEPTLYHGFPQLCKEVAGATQLAVTCTTNGQNFTSELASALIGNVNFIRISLGGLSDLYEKLHNRPIQGLLTSLPIIKDICPIGFNILVSPDSIAVLDELVEFAFSHGAREILLLPLVTTAGDMVLSAEQQAFLSDWVISHYQQYPISISSVASAVISGPRLPIEDPRGPSYDFLHINAAGKISQSAFSGHSVAVTAGLMEAVTLLRSSITEGGAT